MAPLPIFLVGYPVSHEAIERYRTLKNLPRYNNRILVEDLQSKITAPLALVRVETDDGAPSNYYFCCFVDFSDRAYQPEGLLGIPVPSAFHQLPQLIPVEGEVRRLFAPRAMIFSFKSVSPE
jgi:hypothetical protein